MQGYYRELDDVLGLRDEVTPLCTPEFLSCGHLQEGDPDSILDKDRIHVDWGASFASYPTWAAWFHAAGVKRSPQVELGHTTGMSSLAVDLAVSGFGVALGQRLLAREELADGRLVAPFGQALSLGYAYERDGRTSRRPFGRSEGWWRIDPQNARPSRSRVPVAVGTVGFEVEGVADP